MSNFFKVTKEEVDFGGRKLVLETGRIARQAEGAVLASYGDTSVLGGVLELSTSTSETTYSMRLEGLKDETKYYYKINTFDSEDDEYEVRDDCGDDQGNDRDHAQRAVVEQKIEDHQRQSQRTGHQPDLQVVRAERGRHRLD